MSSKFPRISDAAINAVSFLNKSIDPAQNYAACVIGTSMVKQIKPSELFGDKKCFFKSINGGLINDIARCLVARDLLLADCRCFVITCGSNDMDSATKSLEAACSDFLKLIEYLSGQYPDARFIINKLVPRLRTKYLQLEVFEERRAAFNKFLDENLKTMENCVIVNHAAFEHKDSLCGLLSDGVHLSELTGVPAYIEAIKERLI